MEKKLYRHGDLSFHPIKEVEGEIVAHKGFFVLALGEHTGHKHVITVPNIEDMEIHRTSDGGYILTLKKEGTVTHEEHRAVKIKPGTYKMRSEREFDYALNESRKVLD